MAVSMIDRFTNPAAYYEEAKEKGVKTILPFKNSTRRRNRRIKTSVPEKIKI